MNQTSIKRLFKENEGKNFVLSTDVAVGHGLNGVSYTSFAGRKEWEGYGHDKTKYYEKTTIVSYDEDCLIIKVDRYDEPYNSGIFTYAIPYEHIVSIMFVEKITWCNRLTPTL